MSEPIEEKAWVPVFRTGTDYEAELVCDRLNDSGMTAVIQNKRDHAFNLTMGDLARIAVLVPAEQESDALALLAAHPLSDAELTRQALAASPLDPKDATLIELEQESEDDDREDNDSED